MAADTVAAALGCPLVGQVVVVTDDPLVSAAVGGLGAVVVPDVPAAGLNPALAHGAAVASRLRPGTGVAALTADLPALRPVELTAALQAAAGVPLGFVPDAEGTGTTLLAGGVGVGLRPACGPRSAGRHRAAGAVLLAVEGLAGLRRDVDTGADLAAALALGVGPRTAAALGVPARIA
jgi:2-phospho-L-lactate/phosphoenolpyruvate guanylyltransferase